MLKPQSYPQKLKHQNNFLKESFSILVWNIHKENQNILFKNKLKELLLAKPSDFLLFQEVQYPKREPYELQDYSYAIASNMETKKNIYGVLTAAKVAFKNIACKLTKNKEAGITTHKSFIVSQHLLTNGKLLCLVNIHAINFVPIKSFKQEVQEIKSMLIKHKGPMIVVGDFNSWNDKRIEELKKFQNELGLTKVEVKMSHNIKHVFLKPLDHIFYRELDLINAEAIDTENVSDHNPIYANFQT
ncbi:endonuclease/exonuclease/phosphatase family protein [Sulfurimonas sp.]|uniref:endonuclease/exonuclease/phosphatase family protein n=1 Tax=Sulfurimonas sp. TaxID=2022749 RepID=UPI002AB201EA|nr:endonuclease/exonuclease/phosphatase family protein [Sulfurimonas sp.]